MMLFDRKKALNQILGEPKKHMAEGGEVSSLQACVEELINAIHEKDVPSATEALKTVFLELDSEPHEEGEHY